MHDGLLRYSHLMCEESRHVWEMSLISMIVSFLSLLKYNVFPCFSSVAIMLPRCLNRTQGCHKRLREWRPVGGYQEGLCGALPMRTDESIYRTTSFVALVRLDAIKMTLGWQQNNSSQNRGWIDGTTVVGSLGTLWRVVITGEYVV
jgi:hypothetical protein